MTLHHYTVYGLTVSSEMALPLPEDGEGRLAEVYLEFVPATFFDVALGTRRHGLEWLGWFQYLPLADGSSYVRGWEMGELLISADGRHVRCAPEPGEPLEAFFVYLLGQAFSFALIALGFEPLHATAISVDGRAVALAAESGSGKSTLAAAFVAAGGRLLTDDVLVLRDASGEVVALPGPPRLKLFPRVTPLLGSARNVVPMNRHTAKLVVPLDAGESSRTPAPLAAIYLLEPPRGTPGAQGIRIDAVSGRDAALAIVQAAFNQLVGHRERLARQFAAATWLADRVPVRRVAYPRVLGRLPDLVKAVSADAAAIREASGVCAP